MAHQTSLNDFFGKASQQGNRGGGHGHGPTGNENGNRGRGNWRGGGARGSENGRGRGGGHHSDRGGSGGSHRRGNNRGPSSRRNGDLAQVARETLDALPPILAQLPRLDARRSELLDLSTLSPLDPSRCPRHQSTSIRVINEDSFNAAISLGASQSLGSSHASSPPSRVAVLNLASDFKAGGGWLKGATAQEEALCYRSSLYLSLHKQYYPFPSAGTAIYSPDVVVIRGDMGEGKHELLVPGVKAEDLPVVSVVSVAALRKPRTRKGMVLGQGSSSTTGDGVGVQAANARESLDEIEDGDGDVHMKTGMSFCQEKQDTAASEVEDGGGEGAKKETANAFAHERIEFADPKDREVTKGKMRMTLRVAATRGHDLLILGALGCGAFRNPAGEVARCWKEVLVEAEFQGGWWKGVVFAVMDKRGEGNFDVFEEVLGGMQV